MVSDLRKIVLYITLSIVNRQVSSCQNSRDFLQKCVQKFGLEKVKEFMEIQLMHHNELSLQLLDWLDGKCEDRVRQTVPPRVPTIEKKSSVEDIKVSALRTEEDEATSGRGVKLPDMPKVNLDEISKGSRNNNNNQ